MPSKDGSRRVDQHATRTRSKVHDLVGRRVGCKGDRNQDAISTRDCGGRGQDDNRGLAVIKGRKKEWPSVRGAESKESDEKES